MKKSFAILAASLFAGTLFAFSTNAHAADTTGNVAYTAGEVTFDPQTPGDPSASLPTNLNFGTHPIQTTTAETWNATSDGVQDSALTTGRIGVSDNRGTAGTGWAVKVTQQTQFTADTTPLTGAELSFTVGELNNNLDQAPTGPRIANNSTTTLTLGNTTSVLTANAGQGSGETSLPITKFQLDIPANTGKIASTYQTTLNWTFSSTPS